MRRLLGSSLTGKEAAEAYDSTLALLDEASTKIKAFGIPQNIATAEIRAKIDGMLPILVAYRKAVSDEKGISANKERAIADMLDAYVLLNEQTAQLDEAAAALINVVAHTVDESNVAILKSTMKSLWAVIAVTAVVLAAGLSLAVLLTRGITISINAVISDLTEGSTQISEAAGSVSSAASHLAEGATEQAASLEETSSALEQMASMTRQNADNSTRTSENTAKAVQLIGEGAKEVTNMSAAMAEITESSAQISRIIKTIEEIAFQTNLLALNAAVEAARAGEAGKGFAVVADEVRNLAQRSAGAARDTAALIEGTVTRVQNGAEIATKLDSEFKDIDASSREVGRLVQEISSATREQAQGVDQVNTAVAQMDKVTQSNAASAEQCASAAEQLSAQAVSLKGMVGELVAIVTGSTRGATITSLIRKGTRIVQRTDK